MVIQDDSQRTMTSSFFSQHLLIMKVLLSWENLDPIGVKRLGLMGNAIIVIKRSTRRKFVITSLLNRSKKA